jgi:hypothetical protein
VQYDYPRPPPSSPEPSRPGPEHIADLADLSTDWLQAFSHTLVYLNQEKMLALIQTLPPSQATLIQRLTHHVQEFEYEVLMALIQSALRVRP